MSMAVQQAPVNGDSQIFGGGAMMNSMLYGSSASTSPCCFLINDCLDNYLYRDALMLAQLKFAKDDCDDNKLLLSRCLHALGEDNKVLKILGDCQTLEPEGSLILANSSMRLRNYDSVERAICGVSLPQMPSCADVSQHITATFKHRSASAFYVLAEAYRKSGRKRRALDCYRQAFVHAPYLLTAFEALCDLGDQNVSSYVDDNMNSQSVQQALFASGFESHTLPSSCSSKTIVGKQPSNSSQTSTSQPPALSTTDRANRMTGGSRRPTTIKRTNFSKNLPSSRISMDQRQTGDKVANPQSRRAAAVTRKPGRQADVVQRSSNVGTANEHADDVSIGTDATSTSTSTNLRRLKVEFGSRDSIKENTKAPVRTVTTRSTAAHRNIQSSQSVPVDISRPDQADIDYLVSSLKMFAQIYSLAHKHECKKAIRLIDALPICLSTMHWPMLRKAVSLTEMGQYQSAVAAFMKLIEHHPLNLEGMAMYSTALWHLRLDLELSALSHSVSNLDMLSPEVWCVIGNHFSLQREHDVAIKMMKRASQIDPFFTYTYSLLGNEYLVLDDHESAVCCFRLILYHDPRSYRAWYGLGMSCFYKDKHQLALVYFGRALKYNPRSPVLLCHLAVVHHIMKGTDKGLSILDKAISYDPNHSLCRFHRAGMLYAGSRLEDALDELHNLERIVPSESLVFHLMAKVYHRMNNEQLFLANVSWAMKLDPKGAHNSLKESIDRFYCAEEEADRSFCHDVTARQSSAAPATSTAIHSMATQRTAPLSSIPVPPDTTSNLLAETEDIFSTDSSVDGFESM